MRKARSQAEIKIIYFVSPERFIFLQFYRFNLRNKILLQLWLMFRCFEEIYLKKKIVLKISQSRDTEFNYKQTCFVTIVKKKRTIVVGNIRHSLHSFARDSKSIELKEMKENSGGLASSFLPAFVSYCSST